VKVEIDLVHQHHTRHVFREVLVEATRVSIAMYPPSDQVDRPTECCQVSVAHRSQGEALPAGRPEQDLIAFHSDLFAAGE
jgi:hypothetical protein